MSEKMKPEIKALWIGALTSGEYLQGTDRLRDGDSFCCLGVLCDLAEKAGVIVSRKDESNFFQYGNDEEFEDYMQDAAVLPPSVREWSGMPSKDGRISASSSLTSLNDNGTSFKVIAQIIEERF